MGSVSTVEDHNCLSRTKVLWLQRRVIVWSTVWIIVNKCNISGVGRGDDLKLRVADWSPCQWRYLPIPYQAWASQLVYATMAREFSKTRVKPTTMRRNSCLCFLGKITSGYWSSSEEESWLMQHSSSIDTVFVYLLFTYFFKGPGVKKPKLWQIDRFVKEKR